MLRKVGQVLLDPSSAHAPPLTRWLTATDAFNQSDNATSQAMYEASCCRLQPLSAFVGCLTLNPVDSLCKSPHRFGYSQHESGYTINQSDKATE